jgi:hypothetical protein
VFEFLVVLLHYRLKVINSVIHGILKDGNPFAINTVMFASAISGQGTPEQQEMWLQRALNHNILGTYAQVRNDVVTEVT